jgi:hypothetical protein
MRGRELLPKKNKIAGILFGFETYWLKCRRGGVHGIQ